MTEDSFDRFADSLRDGWSNLSRDLRSRVYWRALARALVVYGLILGAASAIVWLVSKVGA